MTKKSKSANVTRMNFLKLPTPKSLGVFKGRWFSWRSILPHIVVIALCVALYYAMIHYYLFFQWGFYIYYLIKLVIAYAILSASTRSLLPPLIALLLGGAVLFTNNLYLTTLMNSDTAWQLLGIGLAGVLIALFKAMRSRH